MDQLKASLLPESQVLALDRVTTRPKLRSLLTKGVVFFLLFLVVMTAFILIVSLTYQPVPSDRTPGYRFNTTLYFLLGPKAPIMIANGLAPSLVVERSLNLQHYNWSTTCTNLTLLDDQYYHILLTLDPMDVGCELNVTLDIEMFPGQSGNFYFVTLDGFELNRGLYPPGQGDLILQTTGYVGHPFTTQVAWRILTGSDGQNIVINTPDNLILELYVDWTRIYLFALAVSGWIWKVVTIPLWTLWLWRRGERSFSDFIRGPEGISVEV